MTLQPWLVLGLGLGLAFPLAAPAAEPTASKTTAIPASATASPVASKAAAPPVRERQGVLVDLKGRGLYTYTVDKPGKSLCDAACVALWPPLYADAAAKPKGHFSLVVRDDGRRQWALRGQPLYRWRGDRERGDAGGDGINGVWNLVRIAAPGARP